MKKHHLHYTLIEVLVAVAVLALMMSFLFQFTAGAQRIWNASNANTDITGNADAIFALLDEDLSQMVVDGAAGMPFTGAVTLSAATPDFGFYAISARRGGHTAGTLNEVGSLIYVQYHYDSSAQCLYRVQRSAEDGHIYATTGTKGNSEPVTGATTFAATDYSDDTLVAEGVEEFAVTVHPNGTTDKVPQILRVQVRLNRTAAQVSQRQSDADAHFEHLFSKVYFPCMN